MHQFPGKTVSKVLFDVYEVLFIRIILEEIRQKTRGFKSIISLHGISFLQSVAFPLFLFSLTPFTPFIPPSPHSLVTIS